jgi:hypothetical protein
MAKTTFTENELSKRLFFEAIKYPYDNDFIEFHGFISRECLSQLKLDHIDRQVVGSDARSDADVLQSLEIIFRRAAEQDIK